MTRRWIDFHWASLKEAIKMLLPLMVIMLTALALTGGLLLVYDRL